jgi:hypothetical protein
MSTHLYCILPNALRGAIPPGLAGVQGARVRALPFDGLVAWVSDAEHGIATSVEGIRAHDGVVEAALETGTTPVPVRFGQRFTDDDACRRALEEKADSLGSVLSNVQGLVEMTLILTPSARRMIRDLEPVIPEMVDEPGKGVGKRYLETLRAREAATGAVRRALDGLAQRLAEAAQSFVLKVSVVEQFARMPFRSISHLISRDAVEPYRRAVTGVDASKEFQFLVVGPRAPYSFCALGASGGGSHGMKLAD